MSETCAIEGIAACIPTANLDTDQIMPKQFLRGVDKRGLDKGLLWDLHPGGGRAELRRDLLFERDEQSAARRDAARFL